VYVHKTVLPAPLTKLRRACYRCQVFLDIGSGIGQVLVQVSALVGCIAIGIELLEARHGAAMKLVQSFAAFAQHTGVKWGQINIEYGNFTHEVFREMITGCDVIYCNNAHDTFGVRADTHGGGGMLTLNASLAALFASTANGTQMVTLDAVPDLDKVRLSLAS
jgi:hypothetical protein